ncbi:MAG: MFS transporter [Candidatus Bathyarchaeia archaeon]
MRHGGFMRLWMGETVEWFGGQITALALPTVAILSLNAGPFEMGLLGALNTIAYPILGLFVGVLADRWRRRPMMVWANIGQVLALGSIPLAFMFRMLSLNQLFAVALVMSVTTVFFVIAYQSYLPTLVDREDLVEGNAKLETSSSASLVFGPALGGLLIQVVGAAQSIIFDAISTLVAALAIQSIKQPEVTTSDTKRAFFKELRAGAEVIFVNPILRTLTAASATLNLGRSMFYAVFFLFIYDQLKITPGTAGLVLGIGSTGFLIGALGAPKIVKKLGLGVTLALALFISGTGLLMVPITMYGLAAPTLAALWMLSNVGMPLYNINQVSLRQAITSNQVQGRMNATMRTITWSTWPVGALAGGILGAILGLPLTIMIAGLITTIPALFIIGSPVVKLSKIPSQPMSV